VRRSRDHATLNIGLHRIMPLPSSPPFDRLYRFIAGLPNRVQQVLECILGDRQLLQAGGIGCINGLAAEKTSATQRSQENNTHPNVPQVGPLSKPVNQKLRDRSWARGDRCPLLTRLCSL